MGSVKRMAMLRGGGGSGGGNTKGICDVRHLDERHFRERRRSVCKIHAASSCGSGGSVYSEYCIYITIYQNIFFFALVVWIHSVHFVSAIIIIVVIVAAIISLEIPTTIISLRIPIKAANTTALTVIIATFLPTTSLPPPPLVHQRIPHSLPSRIETHFMAEHQVRVLPRPCLLLDLQQSPRQPLILRANFPLPLSQPVPFMPGWAWRPKTRLAPPLTVRFPQVVLAAASPFHPPFFPGSDQ
mmetsp:Transcript_955/g.1356  ORF Transcript_955/g.1356 Transcript_955/m.1356 type:complete len:242 (-) Transcript_955:54-779(-)